MKKCFLIISPHPDDAELGLGGTIIKLKEQGHKVIILELTSGEPTPYGSIKKRQQEAEKAAKILGIDQRLNLGLENRYLFDEKRVRLLVAEKIRFFRPDIIFSPFYEDAHPDHIACSRIVEAARFYAKFHKAGLKFRPYYSFYLFYYFCIHLRVLPKITFLVDISEQFQLKMRAIKSYRSQFIDNPQNRYVFDFIKTQNHYFGSLINVQYAEPIFSKEIIKISDLSHLL